MGSHVVKMFRLGKSFAQGNLGNICRQADPPFPSPSTSTVPAGSRLPALHLLAPSHPGFRGCRAAPVPEALTLSAFRHSRYTNMKKTIPASALARVLFAFLLVAAPAAYGQHLVI